MGWMAWSFSTSFQLSSAGWSSRRKCGAPSPAVLPVSATILSINDDWAFSPSSASQSACYRMLYLNYPLFLLAYPVCLLRLIITCCQPKDNHRRKFQALHQPAAEYLPANPKSNNEHKIRISQLETPEYIDEWSPCLPTPPCHSCAAGIHSYALFFLLFEKITKQFLKLNMRCPSRQTNNELRFGILPQTGMTLPKWRVNFGIPRWHVSPESGGQVKNLSYRIQGMPPFGIFGSLSL